ncbi:MAG: TIGR01777 family oxidoreductase [Acidimicrobiales bacterium]
MRVGVTGSSGLIGRSLVQALSARGDQVIRFVRPGTTPPDGAVVRWDPTTRDVDESDLRRAGPLDAIVNLAGTGIGDRRWTAARRHAIVHSRIAATDLVVEIIEHLPGGLAALVSASAVGYYGSHPTSIVDETSPAGTDFLAMVCRRWEDAASRAQRFGTRVALVRTGVVFSAAGGALARQLPLFRRGLGGPLASGRQWVSPISLVDEVRAIQWILDTDQVGPHNLVAPTATTNADMTATLAHALGRRAVLRVPAFALDVALGRGLSREAVLASQNAQPRRLLEEGFTFQHPDVDAIVAASLAS